MLSSANQEATKAEAAHFAVMLKMRLFLDTFLLIMLLELDRFILKYFAAQPEKTYLNGYMLNFCTGSYFYLLIVFTWIIYILT